MDFAITNQVETRYGASMAAWLRRSDETATNKENSIHTKDHQQGDTLRIENKYGFLDNE